MRSRLLRAICENMLYTLCIRLCQDVDTVNHYFLISFKPVIPWCSFWCFIPIFSYILKDWNDLRFKWLHWHYSSVSEKSIQLHSFHVFCFCVTATAFRHCMAEAHVIKHDNMMSIWFGVHSRLQLRVEYAVWKLYDAPFSLLAWENMPMTFLHFTLFGQQHTFISCSVI